MRELKACLLLLSYSLHPTQTVSIGVLCWSIFKFLNVLLLKFVVESGHHVVLTQLALNHSGSDNLVVGPSK